MPIKSPYNFAPAPEEKDVFKPDWSNQVSHDVPFQDGLSGTLDFTLTAVTPIFIRNGTSRNEGSEKETHFSHRKTGNGKEYFIPGSSIKGMVRNVLEIMSCSRMSTTDGTSAKDKMLFGLRDMQNEEYKGEIVGVVNSGWLKKVGEEYFIYPCTHHRIALTDISRKLADGASLKNDQTAAEKCKLVGADELKKLRTFHFADDLGRWVGKLYAFGNGDEEIEGRIVLYGDIDNKRYDYIFTKPAARGISVPNELFDKFISMQEEIRSRLPKKEREKDNLWDFFQKNNFTEIPVFYKANAAGTKVEHFGFSKLYRLNNPQWLRDIRPFSGYQKGDEADYEPDMAELLFGYINKGTKPQSLKGRITFSHAFSKNAQPASNEQVRILSSPRASFYPAYLEQDSNGVRLRGSYKTYHNADATARGFKRYPVHSSVKPDIDAGTSDMEVPFRPLNEGALFSGKLVYHNLRPAELGALLSALTFHNNTDECFHSLGMAKPYGFGKVRVFVMLTNKHLNALRAFEYEMNKHTGKSWVSSKAVKELLAMSQAPKDTATNNLLAYPTIEPINEFNEYKRTGMVLEPYSIRNACNQRWSSLLDEQSRAAFEELDKKQNAATDRHLRQRKLFEERQREIVDQLHKRKSALGEEEEKNAHKDKSKQNALENGLDLSKVKDSDKGIFNTIAKAIESYMRATQNTPLTEKDLTSIIQKLEEAAKKQNAVARRKWQEQPQYSWERLELYIPAQSLKAMRQKIESIG